MQINLLITVFSGLASKKGIKYKIPLIPLDKGNQRCQTGLDFCIQLESVGTFSMNIERKNSWFRIWFFSSGSDPDPIYPRRFELDSVNIKLKL